MILVSCLNICFWGKEYIDKINGVLLTLLLKEIQDGVQKCCIIWFKP